MKSHILQFKKNRRKPSLALLSALVPKSDYSPPSALPLKKGDRLSFIRWFTHCTYFSQQGHFYSVFDVKSSDEGVERETKQAKRHPSL